MVLKKEDPQRKNYLLGILKSLIISSICFLDPIALCRFKANKKSANPKLTIKKPAEFINENVKGTNENNGPFINR